jgi:hypothetical protein
VSYCYYLHAMMEQHVVASDSTCREQCGVICNRFLARHTTWYPWRRKDIRSGNFPYGRLDRSRGCTSTHETIKTYHMIHLIFFLSRIVYRQRLGYIMIAQPLNVSLFYNNGIYIVVCTIRNLSQRSRRNMLFSYWRITY